MKFLIIIILMVAVLLPVRAFDHFAENDNIREAIVRYEFAKYPSQASLYFVSVYDAKTGKQVDPDDDLIKRFVGRKQHIEKSSQSKSLEDQGHRLVDIQSGEAGTLFSFGGIVRKSEDTAEVDCSIEERDNMGGGFKFTLKKTNQKWEVISSDTTWLP